MTGAEAAERTRALFVGDSPRFGCAETALAVLKEAFGLADPTDVSAATALNGGVAYSGSMCGAITGSAIAAGLYAGRRLPDHLAAKGAARFVTARLVRAFSDEFGALDCRDLVGLDLASQEQHDRFMASDVWQTVCLRQVEFAVGQLAGLADDPIWQARSGDEPGAEVGVTARTGEDRCSHE